MPRIFIGTSLKLPLHAGGGEFGGGPPAPVAVTLLVPAHRLPPHHAQEERDRRDDERKHDHQEDPGVDCAQHRREFHPVPAHRGERGRRRKRGSQKPEAQHDCPARHFAGQQIPRDRQHAERRGHDHSERPVLILYRHHDSPLIPTSASRSARTRATRSWPIAFQWKPSGRCTVGSLSCSVRSSTTDGVPRSARYRAIASPCGPKPSTSTTNNRLPSATTSACIWPRSRTNNFSASERGKTRSGSSRKAAMGPPLRSASRRCTCVSRYDCHAIRTSTRLKSGVCATG